LNPIITICSHFIIMGVILHEIIPWDQIVTVSLKKNPYLLHIILELARKR
jgi:hypothetical protein